MTSRHLDLPEDAPAALDVLREASKATPVAVFKKSPICPVSFHAESEWNAWLSDLGDGVAVLTVEIDVLAQKPLARGLTSELGIAHQSPQLLFFRGGDLVFHDSHDRVTRELLAELMAGGGESDHTL